MRISKAYICPIIFLSLVCFLFSPLTSLAKIYHLTILHTNDHKGHLTKFSWHGIPDVGGMAARSTLVNIVRAEVEQAGGHVLLLSAGDVNYGMPESDLLKAKPDFKLMKMMGYDAMTLGNQDFNNPHEVLMQQREWAGFPFLSAIMIEKETGEPLVDPYIIKKFDGLKVAIFGLTSEDTPVVIVGHRNDLDSRNVIETARELVPTLREAADLVIALTHIYFEGIRGPGDVQVAKAVPGIDVIVGGHERIALEEPTVVGDTMIVQAGEYGLYVGRLDLTIDSDTDNIIEYTYTLLPVNLKKEITYHDASYYMYVDKGYVEDPAILEFIQPYLEQTDEVLSQPVGEALVRLDGDRLLIRSQETNLANLVTDAMRAKTGADIAFIEAGWITGSIEPGIITSRDILRVLPYRLRLVLLDLTGEQVMDNLRQIVAVQVAGYGAFSHYSGVRWTNNKGVPENVMVGDAPIELARMYKVVLRSFTTDVKYPTLLFEGITLVDTGFTDASALRDYIKKAGKVAPKVDGRLTIIE